MEVGNILAGILGRSGAMVPEPEEFFRRFGQYKQIHVATQRPRNGRRRAA